MAKKLELGDCMMEVDYAIGKIRKTIKDAGLEKNTIVIFSSDNGPWVMFNNTKNHGKYGEARIHVGYAMPFRDGKGSTWEGGHRVTGIICWPGKMKGNRVVQEPVSTLDILPTIFKIAGVKQLTDRKIDGRDIRSLLFPSKSYPKLDPFTFSITTPIIGHQRFASDHGKCISGSVHKLATITVSTHRAKSHCYFK